MPAECTRTRQLARNQSSASAAQICMNISFLAPAMAVPSCSVSSRKCSPSTPAANNRERAYGHDFSYHRECNKEKEPIPILIRIRSNYAMCTHALTFWKIMGRPLQELDKPLPKSETRDGTDMDKPPELEVRDHQESSQDKQFSIKISPLARPYISFGPDIRQHPCAMNAGTKTTCVLSHTTGSCCFLRSLV